MDHSGYRYRIRFVYLCSLFCFSERNDKWLVGDPSCYSLKPLISAIETFFLLVQCISKGITALILEHLNLNIVLI